MRAKKFTIQVVDKNGNIVEEFKWTGKKYKRQALIEAATKYPEYDIHYSMDPYSEYDPRFKERNWAVYRTVGKYLERIESIVK